MRVKPDFGQVLSKAAFLLDSLVVPPSKDKSEQTKHDSSSTMMLEDEQIRNDRRNSGGNMDEIMASLLVENVNTVANTRNKDIQIESEDLN